MLNEKVKLVELNENNWYDCCLLELSEEQKEYMESNAISIAQSKFEPTLKTYAILFDNEAAGFAMYNSEIEELDGFWIYRIMLDKKYQRKGIGKTATELLIKEMAKIPNCNRIVVGYHPENKGAHQLYSKLGFVDKGDRFGKEMAVVLDL